MPRLHLIMNDPDLPAPMRQAIADAVLEATRADMVSTGRLNPDEPLMLLFHGATDERTRSMRGEGIDRALIAGGGEQDFGTGVYLTPSVGTAISYRKGPTGEIFPFLLRGRDVGVTVDVSPAGTHRAAWESFLDANIGMFPDLMPIPGQPIAFGSARLFGNRGLIFDAFLGQLARQTGRPELATPDFVQGEYNGRIIGDPPGEDQFAARTTRVINVLNDQMGFRRAAPVGGGEGPVLRTARDPDQPAMLRSARGDEADQPDAGKPAPVVPAAPAPIPPAPAAPAAPARKQKQSAQPLDLQEAEAATRKREAQEEVARAAREEARRVQDVTANAETLMARLQAKKPAETEAARSIIRHTEAETEIARRSEVTDRKHIAQAWKDRADELESILHFDGELDEGTRRYLEWQEQKWRLIHAMEAASTHAPRKLVVGLEAGSDLPGSLRKQVEDVAGAGEKKSTISAVEQSRREAELRVQLAREAETVAARSIKNEMRREGPNYRAKQKAKFDEVLGEDRFALRQAAARENNEDPILLSPDHLVPLDTIANLEELKPIFAIYNRADQGQRDDIRRELIALGDIPDNLVAFQRYPNEHIKRAKAWSELDRAALARYGYTDADVDDMVRREQKMREDILEIIDEMIKRHARRLGPAARTLPFRPLVPAEEPEEPEE
jgi:hypothetical protein